MSAPAPPRPTRVRPVPPVNVLIGVDPVHCRPVHDSTGRALHHHVRHTVFVEEQRVFTDTDVDAHDARTDVIHVLALHAGRPAGAVRLYPTGTGEWLGDRLGVLREFRTANIGAPLVRFAVAAAAARGARLMRAHVQVANERFFHRLGWRTDGPVETYVGHPHVPMCIKPAALCPWVAGTTPR